MIELGKTYKTRDGKPVRIYAIDGSGDFPVHGAIQYSDEAGWIPEQWTITGLDGLTSRESNLDLIDTSPYADLKIDDKVIVWNNGSVKFKRYFAGVSVEGLPLTFQYGCTSWSNNEPPVAWEFCEKWRKKK